MSSDVERIDLDMRVRNNRYLSDEYGRFQCPTCTTRFRVSELRNDISVREAGISGMCQKCQDSIFGED